MLRYRSSSAYNQLLIAHIKSNIICMKYLPPARPKMVPKLKGFRVYWNFAKLIFQVCQSQFWCQKWFLLNIYHLLGSNWSKIKSVQNLLKFDTFNISITPISIWCQNNFHQMLTNCWAQICSRITNAQNLLKFTLIDISNMPILILKSKINFMKYLLPN